jgi:hypothetical protein
LASRGEAEAGTVITGAVNITKRESIGVLREERAVDMKAIVGS